MKENSFRILENTFFGTNTICSDDEDIVKTWVKEIGI